MYINRIIEDKINQLSSQFKVILITGARQVGKSTVLKMCDSKRNYISLDDPKARLLALNDPEMFLEKYAPPITIDEIQYAPNLFPYIKMIVDNSDKKGQYWLTGSQQFSMMENVTESLAGRVAIINLKGLSIDEIQANPYNEPFIPTNEFIQNKRKTSKTLGLRDVYEMIWRGSYPEINSTSNIDWQTFYGSYLQTYIERDIKHLNIVSSEVDFLKFIKVIAARTGQMLNYLDIANEVGISQHIAKNWLDLLIRSDIIYLLPPYFRNINKRILKTPKVYFSDTGLCSYLTDWETPQTLESGAMSGAIFETFVVNEIIKSYKNAGKEPNIYYYRDKDKKEIDVIIERNGKLYPIEIKKTANPDKSMVKNFAVIPNDRLGEGAVVCLVKDDLPLTENVNILPVGYI